MDKRKFDIKLWSWFFFIIYSICLVYWMFSGFNRSKHDEISYNVLPFRTILQYITHIHVHNLWTTAINLLGNIGIFTPFGIVLPYLFLRMRRFYIFSVYFVCSIVLLETLQTYLKVGSGDVDDLILNYGGACLGYWAFINIPDRYYKRIQIDRSPPL